MSIFHSVPPARHGIVSNTYTPMARPLPGLIETLNLAGKRCAFITNWEPLRNLNQPEQLELSYFRNTSYQMDGDQQSAEVAVRLLNPDDFDFAFIYFGNVDTSGHAFGWMSDEYLQQVGHIDRSVETVLNGIAGEHTATIHADHGGHARTHGEAIPEDMTIPWIAHGPGIKRGYSIQAQVSLLDTAPTLARMLGVRPNPQWEGKVVEEIFI